MAIRTIGTPYDHNTLAELQTFIGQYLGVAWSSLATDAQTTYQRFIDESFEHLTKKFGHEPWMQHRESFSLAASVNEFSPSLACRLVMRLTETYGGQTRLVRIATWKDYDEAWGTGADSHPWNQQESPIYLYAGMDTSNPPKQRWLRYPTPDAEVTGSVLCRPYLTLIGSSGDQQYTHIPPAGASALHDLILYKIEKFTKNFAAASVHKSSAEEEIALTNQTDNPIGAAELPVEIGEPSWVTGEMEP
jgi:hypothetical protein